MNVIAFCENCPPIHFPDFGPSTFVTWIIIGVIFAVSIIAVLMIDEQCKKSAEKFNSDDDNDDDEILDLDTPVLASTNKKLAAPVVKPLRLVNKKQAESKWNDFVIPTKDMQKIVVPVTQRERV